jgi:hypothetical protein
MPTLNFALGIVRRSVGTPDEGIGREPFACGEGQQSRATCERSSTLELATTSDGGFAPTVAGQYIGTKVLRKPGIQWRPTILQWVFATARA